jgi:hypothetical protein
MKREISSQGIIIRKHFPKKVCISVLDEHLGHLRVIPSSWQWASYSSVGALINYVLIEEGDTFFVKHVELEMIPSYQNEDLLLFMHHLMEICCFCLPVQGGKTESFDLLHYAVTFFGDISQKPLAQRLLLAKLLFILGQYPIDVDQLSVSLLLHKPYPLLLELALTHEHKKELEIFIYQCIKFHPYGRLLKTVNFLSQVR